MGNSSLFTFTLPENFKLFGTTGSLECSLVWRIWQNWTSLELEHCLFIVGGILCQKKFSENYFLRSIYVQWPPVRNSDGQMFFHWSKQCWHQFSGGHCFILFGFSKLTGEMFCGKQKIMEDSRSFESAVLVAVWVIQCLDSRQAHKYWTNAG